MLMHTHVHVHAHLHTCMHTWRVAARGTEAAARHKVTTKPLGQWHVDVAFFVRRTKNAKHGKSTLSRRSIFGSAKAQVVCFWPSRVSVAGRGQHQKIDSAQIHLRRSRSEK